MSKKKVKPGKSVKSMDQTDPQNESTGEKQPAAPERGVFMMRGEGQSWEEFKVAVIKGFRGAGLLKEKGCANK